MARFHVFLSHNSKDKPVVRALKQALVDQGLKCWLDEEQLRPGLPWPDLLEQGIKGSASVAVCVAADGLGPWEDQEMQAALRLAVNDGRPVIPVLLPGVPNEPMLPLFLGGLTWVDLRAGLDLQGIENLVWGITGEKSGERTLARTDASAKAGLPIPSESAFLDDVFELLYTHPTLILLTQADRDQRASLMALRERSVVRFGRAKSLHLVPPRNLDASEAEFFRALGRGAGMAPLPNSSIDFADYLEDRLEGGNRLFLLVTGLGKCSDNGQEKLADILRRLLDHPEYELQVVLVGGEKLAELKYAQGDLSLLSLAEPVHWPELNTGDLTDLARQEHPPLDLAPEEALTILQVSGGHLRLIKEALRCRGRGGSVDECSRGMARSRQIEARLTALAQDPKDAHRLSVWLDQQDLGPYREWIKDPLLRRLYWMNLLRRDGLTGAKRLVWRCPAVIDAGRRIVG